MTIREVFIYLRARDAEAAIAFYTAAFGAAERFRLVEPGGRIGHAELTIGPSILMISDPFPEYGIHAPAEGTDAAVSIHLHVDDADALIDRAVAAGARLVRAPQDHFYGERSGAVLDPFGYTWLIGHAVEEVTPEEMQRRYAALFAPGAGG
ncbi:VOC family protein [Azospirillum halopraeferens]|uniref:VOC family protein n=1 Tax=Azospirillum halopraeferens TaxID=34010 RepID=UPI00041C4060|nr:VOC family protein [Azospirillum halopraeferens]